MGLCNHHTKSERNRLDCSICELTQKLKAARFDLLEARKASKTDPAALRRQRDALLEACRKANTCASIPDYVRDVIRAAIANAEPQTGTAE